jgi:hypothetical protein
MAFLASAGAPAEGALGEHSALPTALEQQSMKGLSSISISGDSSADFD